MNNKIGVCILDSGIVIHPEFDDRIDEFVDFVGTGTYPYDDNGHGTHVAGIIAGNKCGVAPLSRIISCKVLDAAGKGSNRSMCKACYWIIDNREKYNIRVVNISVGAGYKKKSMKEQELLKCVEKLSDNGIIVLCAAGNNGPAKGSVTVPGNSRKVITIGSYDDDEYKDASNVIHRDYSGRGDTVNSVIKPDFLSYGHNVRSASNKGGYEIRSGTSMATPKITGLVALILEKYPQMDILSVKAKLKSMAISLDMPINRQGFGLINVSKCIDKI